MFDLAGRKLGQEFPTMRAISILAWTELHADQMPLSIDSGVDLGIQASTRPAETAALVGVVFFSPA